MERKKPVAAPKLVGLWNSTTKKLPPVNEAQEWDKVDKISIEVMTYSRYGLRWGMYYYKTKSWRLFGVTSSTPIHVMYWSEIIIPNGNNKD